MLHSEYVLLSLVNKKADWPIVEQDKFRWETKIENDERKKGRVPSQQPDTDRKGDKHAILIKVPPHGRV